MTLSLSLSTTSDPNNHGVALVVMALTLKCLTNPGVKFSLKACVGSCRWSSEDPILMGIVYLQALIHQTLGIPQTKPCWSDYLDVLWILKASCQSQRSLRSLPCFCWLCLALVVYLLLFLLACFLACLLALCSLSSLRSLVAQFPLESGPQFERTNPSGSTSDTHNDPQTHDGWR